MTDGKKTKTDFKKEAINILPNDKPVVYKILNNENENIYTGVAKNCIAARARVEVLMDARATSRPNRGSGRLAQAQEKSFLGLGRRLKVGRRRQCGTVK